MAAQHLFQQNQPRENVKNRGKKDGEHIRRRIAVGWKLASCFAKKMRRPKKRSLCNGQTHRVFEDSPPAAWNEFGLLNLRFAVGLRNGTGAQFFAQRERPVQAVEVAVNEKRRQIRVITPVIATADELVFPATIMAEKSERNGQKGEPDGGEEVFFHEKGGFNSTIAKVLFN